MAHELTDIVQFFRLNGYVFELFMCNLIFTFSREKQRHYLLRLLLSLLVMVFSAVLLNRVQSTSVLYNEFKYTIWFFITVAANMFCYKINFSIALFIGVGAFISQHLAFKTGEIVRYFLPQALPQQATDTLYLLTTVCVYVFSYCVYAKRFKKTDGHYKPNKQLLFFYFAVSVYITILQFLFDNYISRIDLILYLIYASFDIICCLFAMMLQSGVIRTNSLEEENRLMEHMLHMQKEKFELSKENIELINVKFHDLKKQLFALNGADEQELQRIYQTLSIYDMSVKSGSEALDIVLAEKSLICEKGHIRLECIADGGGLAFMNVSDIYSLMGNAIDNAIESVLKVEDQERRFINITIKQARECLLIHIENPYEGELSFQDGLPMTTKTDKAFHGFGMKSIQRVVDKYNGYLSILSRDNLFTLNIAFMPPRSTSGKASQVIL